MELKRFTLAVCFDREKVRGFQREQAWRCISEAVYPDDLEDADLYEYSKGSVYGCVLTNMKLGKSRNVSSALGRNLPVMASVDWSRPFLLHNALEHAADLKPVGKIGRDGMFIPAEGETLELVLSGPKGKRWINPWKKKRMLLVWPDGERSAQLIARSILAASERKRTEKDLVVFTVEQGFLPDILLFLNDFRRQTLQNGNGGETDAAVSSDGTVILGNVSSEELKEAADHYIKLGYHRIIAETDSRPDAEIAGADIEYLSPRNHLRNLFLTYGFERLAKRCDRAAVIVPDQLPEEAVSILNRAGVRYEVYRTPSSEQECAAVVAALLDK